MTTLTYSSTHAQADAFKAQAAYWRKQTETEFPDINNLYNDSEKVQFF